MAQALCWSDARKRKIITLVGALFGSEFFLDSPLEDLRQPLAALHRQCSKRIWGLRKDELIYNIHQVMRDPPRRIVC